MSGSSGPDKEGAQQILAWHQDQFRTAAVGQVIEILCYLCESFALQGHLGVSRAAVPASVNIGQDMQRMHLPVDTQSANAGIAPVTAASAGHLLSLAAGATQRPYYSSFARRIGLAPSFANVMFVHDDDHAIVQIRHLCNAVGVNAGAVIG